MNHEIDFDSQYRWWKYMGTKGKSHLEVLSKIATGSYSTLSKNTPDDDDLDFILRSSIELGTPKAKGSLDLDDSILFHPKFNLGSLSWVGLGTTRFILKSRWEIPYVDYTLKDTSGIDIKLLNYSRLVSKVLRQCVPCIGVKGNWSSIRNVNCKTAVSRRKFSLFKIYPERGKYKAKTYFHTMSSSDKGIIEDEYFSDIILEKLVNCISTTIGYGKRIREIYVISYENQGKLIYKTNKDNTISVTVW